MKVYYLKGMSTNKEELNLIKESFEDKYIEFESLIDDYSEICGLSKKGITKYLVDKLPKDENINIVAHSMGCNFALLLANELDNISTITFVSPEFEEVDDKERKEIVPSTNETVYKLSTLNFGIKKIRSILLFLRSKKWINRELFFFFFKKNTRTLVIYSKGDQYVSRRILNQMEEYDNVSLFEADSNSHNPLIENTGAIEEISSKALAQDLIKKLY